MTTKKVHKNTLFTYFYTNPNKSKIYFAYKK